MKNLSLRLISTLFVFHSTLACASQYEAKTPEGQFKLSAAINQALPSGTYSYANLDIAWKHQEAIRKMANEHGDLFSDILPDGEVATVNKMGFHWGYAPSITVALSEIIPKDRPASLLEIGSCYGFDTIELIQRYPELQATCVELDYRHTDTMQRLMDKTLTKEQKERVTVHTGCFLNEHEFGLSSQFSNQQFDVAVVSKVLHFYDDEDIFTFLQHLYPVLKPGGLVVMTHMSNRCHKAVELVTWMLGGFVPKPETILPALSCRGSLTWMYYFSQDDMRRLAEKAHFDVLTNVYLGTVHDVSAASYARIPGFNGKECILHTLLQKPKTTD